MKIVIAFDSFKGSADSLALAQAARKGILQVMPTSEIVIFPLADGGEGTTRAISQGLNAREVYCSVHDALMNPIETAYAISPDGVAVMEMAAACGLPLITEDHRNPRYTTTYGTGEMIADAIRRGCRRFILGLGGSATNDAGIGLLQALGMRFLDADGRCLDPIGDNLANIADVDETDVIPQLRECEFLLACDVNNPFAGPNGAAHIYAGQKGADASDINLLDSGLQHFAKVIEKLKHIDISQIPGAGAAGGMGGGLIAFLPAKLRPGIDIILETLQIQKELKNADLVITGEGKLDHQTVMGKALGGILQLSKDKGVPVVALGGSIEQTDLLNQHGFTAVFSIQPGPVSLNRAMDTDYALENVRRIVTQIIRMVEPFKNSPLLCQQLEL